MKKTISVIMIFAVVMTMAATSAFAKTLSCDGCGAGKTSSCYQYLRTGSSNACSITSGCSCAPVWWRDRAYCSSCKVYTLSSHSHGYTHTKGCAAPKCSLR